MTFSMSKIILAVENLKKYYPVTSGCSPGMSPT